MRWEELTGDTFPEAVERCGGVCLVTLSVIERHGHHLPLGTDMYQGRAALERAAKLEPAIVYPDYVYTQISEARHLPGTISLGGAVLLVEGIDTQDLLPQATRERLTTEDHPDCLMRRRGLPEEIAAAIAFLASDDASYVTGVVLCVDGGRVGF